MMTLTGRLLLTLHAEVGRGIGCGEAEGNRRRSPFRSWGPKHSFQTTCSAAPANPWASRGLSRGHHERCSGCPYSNVRFWSDSGPIAVDRPVQLCATSRHIDRRRPNQPLNVKTRWWSRHAFQTRDPSKLTGLVYDDLVIFNVKRQFPHRPPPHKVS